VYREYEILSKIDHPNIVKAHELIHDEFKSSTTIIMDYVDGRTLEEIVAEEGKISEEKMRKYIK